MTAIPRLALIALSCLALGAALHSQSATDPLAAVRAEQIEAELVAVHSDDGLYFSVSPDGKKIAVMIDDAIRILDASTKEVLVDIAGQMTSFDVNSFSWSPDSKKAALTEDFTRRLHDSDLWILDLERGESRRLFADEIANLLSARTGNAVLAPSWSSDGNRLLAVLYDYSLHASFIKRISDYDERTASIVYAAKSESDIAIWTGVYVSGDYVYFTVDSSKRSGPEDGIHRATLDGAESRLILSPDATRGEPILLAVGTDGKYALASHLAYANTYSSDFIDAATGEYTSAIILIDLSDFSTRHLKSGKKIEGRFSVSSAAFSRDGSKVVYAVSEEWAGRRLMIQDAGGGGEYVLFDNENLNRYMFGCSYLRDRSPIFWTNDDKLFVVASNGRELLEFKLSLK